MATLAPAERWIRRRHPPIGGPLRLHRRRLYILPSGFGVLFGLLLLVLLLWSINYSNSLGFVLTFWLASVVLVAMWRCHNNLLGLRLAAERVEPVFAGDAARFEFLLDHPDRGVRLDIALQRAGEPGTPEIVDVDRHGSRATLNVPALRRGWLRPGRLRVSTSYPLGLFRAWSWAEFDRACLVYPAPRGGRSLPLPEPRAGSENGGEQIDGDDFSGLRRYRPGDAPRHVAWKASTRGDELRVKQFTGSAPPELWLDWAQLPNLPDEARLSQLCRWVLEAEARGCRYGLRLPGRTVEPGQGGAHCGTCLRVLALYGLAETPA